ncbi:MAG: nucleoside-diphosphate sugar epimerase [Clostridiales bacterium]|nr:MAG: nucleoside-diphosphate sugar epimerase [Clostridiales bacterium]
MNRRILARLIVDIIILLFSYFFALFLRFDFVIPEKQMYLVLYNLPFIIVPSLLVFYFSGIYKTIWKYADIREYINIVFACMLSVFFSFLYSTIFARGIPRSIYPIVLILASMLMIAVRLSSLPKKNSNSTSKRKRIMIVGAGEAGVLVLKEIRSLSSGGKVICFIDDDPAKINRIINGIEVVGDRNTIGENVNKYGIEEIIIALPSIKIDEKRNIIEKASETGKKVRIVPGVYESITDKIENSDIREVNIEDLLCRETIEMDQVAVRDFVSDKVVLVTGAGGSIGSELVRQLSYFPMKKIILFDIYENSIHALQNELKRTRKKVDFSIVIDSVRDKNRVERIFKKYKPDVVFHAAAHKHVPLMEYNVSSAILNNVIGTYNVASLAAKYNAERFVLISTDKAVNPTNVMGATKRLCELIVSGLNNYGSCEFVSVRFGNVLGSNGSVIPIFKEQIKRGGPVTITHRDVKRYFMSIKEAAQLVLQAGAIAEGGEIFILDMGEQIKIMDLAKNLITLCGKKVGKDIKIVEIGLRPGEKMFEEILINEKDSKTKYEKIYIEERENISLEYVENTIEKVKKAVDTLSNDDLVYFLVELVSSYEPNRENM